MKGNKKDLRGIFEELKHFTFKEGNKSCYEMVWPLQSLSEGGMILVILPLCYHLCREVRQSAKQTVSQPASQPASWPDNQLARQSVSQAVS